jgi:hypothetical protein
VAIAVAFTFAPVRAPGSVRYVVRPLAQGDPPDTLFARRCSLLL